MQISNREHLQPQSIYLVNVVKEVQDRLEGIYGIEGYDLLKAASYLYPNRTSLTAKIFIKGSSDRSQKITNLWSPKEDSSALWRCLAKVSSKGKQFQDFEPVIYIAPSVADKIQAPTLGEIVKMWAQMVVLNLEVMYLILLTDSE